VKPLSEQNLYELLEVPVGASEEEIVRAWERAEAMYGPNSLSTYSLISPEESALLGTRLEEALNVLLDPAKRERYDAKLSQAPAAPQPVPIAFSEGARNSAGGKPVAAGARSMSDPVAVLSLAEMPERSAPPLAKGDREAPCVLGPVSGGGAGDPAEVGAPVLVDAIAAPVSSLAVSARPAILLSRVVPECPAASQDPPPCAVVTQAPASEPAAEEAVVGKTPEPPAKAAGKGLFVPEGTCFTGEVLRQVREVHGLTLAQISDRTKIGRHHLENVEGDRFERLPAPVYLRGILVALARELRLDAQKVVPSYLESAGVASQSRGRS